jgi:predicted peptidase
MKMKNSMLLASMAALVVLSSCRKEQSDVKKPDPAEKSSILSSQNDLPETSAPIFKAVESSVVNNVAGYYVGLPSRYDSTTKNYPLLVFIHGIGELSTANKNMNVVTTVGATRLLSQQNFPASFTVNGKSFSFIVVSPQFKEWPKSSDVNALVDYMVEKYRVDASRIYVAGLSMGGGATWDFAGDFSSRVAAIVPISGASYAEEKRCANIASGKVAVWAFHNSSDRVVAPSVSKQFVEKINSNHAQPAALLTMFESNDHDAWTKATDPSYKENGMNIYEWMLQYSKSSK